MKKLKKAQDLLEQTKKEFEPIFGHHTATDIFSHATGLIEDEIRKAKARKDFEAEGDAEYNAKMEQEKADGIAANQRAASELLERRAGRFDQGKCEDDDLEPFQYTSSAEGLEDPDEPEGTEDPPTPEGVEDPEEPKGAEDPPTRVGVEDPEEPEGTEDPPTPAGVEDPEEPKGAEDPPTPAAAEDTGKPDTDQDPGPPLSDHDVEVTNQGKVLNRKRIPRNK